MSRTPDQGSPHHSRSTSGERSFISYILVPRPRDLIKTLIAPASYVVSAAAIGSFSRIREFLTLWFILEFLIYYARYQWNDIRGAANDRVHPERLSRARLPVGTTEEERRQRVNLSLVVAGARLLIAILVGLALGAVGAVAILIVAVWSIAVVYETLRGRPSAQPLGVTGPREIGVWLAVGLGYVVRAGLGLTLAGLDFDELILFLGLTFSFVFGAMYVLLSWALEASNFCARIGSRWVVADGLQRKPHMFALLPYVDGSRPGDPARVMTSEPISRTTPGYLGDAKVLDARGEISCPWNIALLIGAPLSGLLGAGLAGPIPASASAMTATLCGGGAACLCHSGKSAIRWVTVATVAAALATLAIAAGAASAWAIPVPWLAIAACYARFRSMSYLDSMDS